MNLKFLFLCLVLSFAQLAAQSEEQDWSSNYIYFKFGQMEWDENSDRLADLFTERFELSANHSVVSEEVTDNVYKIGDGYGFNDYFGLEGEAIYFGESNVVVSDGANTYHFRRRGYGANVGAALQMRLGLFMLYGKAGVTFWRYETKLDPAVTGKLKEAHEKGFEPLLAAGLRLDMGNRAMLDMSWEHSDVDQQGYNSVALAIAFKY